MEDRIGISKLPYDIKLIDLITEGMLIPIVFVRLPNEFFNQPVDLRAHGEEVEAATHCEPQFRFKANTPINNLGHSYDKALKSSFVDRFSVKVPSKLDSFTNAKGHNYYPYEAYVPYWYGYILLEAIEQCKFIDHYLDKKTGGPIFKMAVRKYFDFWISTYNEIYEPLSDFITLNSQIHTCMKNESHHYSDNDIHEYMLSKYPSKDTSYHVQSIGKLLELHKIWTDKSDGNGIKQYSKALMSLRVDIYYLYEWYRIAGGDIDSLFEHFEYKNRESYGWSQLKDVLNFDYYQLLGPFIRVSLYYVKNEPTFENAPDLKTVYKKLYQYLAFDPWLRSFDDMRKNSISKNDLNLTHPRTLENLLVLTIRTEVLLRSVFASFSKSKEPEHIKSLLKELANSSKNNNFKIAILSITEKPVWDTTKLTHTPLNVFNAVEEYASKTNLDPTQLHIAKSFLTFVIARNYFAHHYYNDSKFSRYYEESAGDVVKACLFTVIYLSEIIKVEKPIKKS